MLIHYEQVSKLYGPDLPPALDGVDLTIDQGEFVFLVGSSGAGKSTCLMMAYRYVLPTTGKLWVADTDLRRMRKRDIPLFRRKIGVVFQDYRLLPRKSVFDNVAFALRVTGTPYRQIKKRVLEVLDMVGLLDRANAYPNQLSGGEQQRVGLARAVVNHPLLILADEPTGNLDPRTSEHLMDMLLEINRSGTTVVVATHDQTCVDRLRRRVVVLDRGQVVADRTRGAYAV